MRTPELYLQVCKTCTYAKISPQNRNMLQCTYPPFRKQMDGKSFYFDSALAKTLEWAHLIKEKTAMRLNRKFLCYSIGANHEEEINNRSKKQSLHTIWDKPSR